MNENTDKALADFMSDSDYEHKIACGDCKRNFNELISELKNRGYEVWPEVRTSDNKECCVHYRIRK
jgi:hypothetical protein